VIVVSCLESLHDAIDEGISKGFKSLSSDLRKGIIKIIGAKGEATALEIQRELGYTLVSVIDACKLLEKNHYLTREERPGRGPKRTKTVYKLTDLGKLAYLVLSWSELDRVLRDLVEPFHYKPNIDEWLKDPCLRELIQLSICRVIQGVRPEETYTYLKENFGNVFEFITLYSFLVMWYSVSRPYLVPPLSHEDLINMRKKGFPDEYIKIAEAVVMYSRIAFNPIVHAGFFNPAITEKFLEIAKKKSAAVFTIEENIPNLLKLLIDLHSRILMIVTFLLEIYEKTEMNRMKILEKAFRKAFKDIILLE